MHVTPYVHAEQFECSESATCCGCQDRPLVSLFQICRLTYDIMIQRGSVAYIQHDLIWKSDSAPVPATPFLLQLHCVRVNHMEEHHRRTQVRSSKSPFAHSIARSSYNTRNVAIIGSRYWSKKSKKKNLQLPVLMHAAVREIQTRPLITASVA